VAVIKKACHGCHPCGQGSAMSGRKTSIFFIEKANGISPLAATSKELSVQLTLYVCWNIFLID